MEFHTRLGMTISVRIITLFLALALLFGGGAISLNLVMAQDAQRGEYDADGDRLIEISNLEQLNAVRYDLSDGNGRPDDSDDADVLTAPPSPRPQGSRSATGPARATNWTGRWTSTARTATPPGRSTPSGTGATGGCPSTTIGPG